MGAGEVGWPGGGRGAACAACQGVLPSPLGRLAGPLPPGPPARSPPSEVPWVRVGEGGLGEEGGVRRAACCALRAPRSRSPLVHASRARLSLVRFSCTLGSARITFVLTDARRIGSVRLRPTGMAMYSMFSEARILSAQIFSENAALRKRMMPVEMLQ